MVLPLVVSAFAVADGVLGADVVAGQAVGAVSMPSGVAIVEGDVLQRTCADAQAAGNAFGCGVEGLVTCE